MIKALIFDCFGVLVNDGLQTMIDELRKTDPDTAEQVVDVVQLALQGKIDAEDSRERVAALLGLSFDDYKTAIKRAEVKNQELLDYILTLRAKYKTAMLSNILPGGLAARFTPQEMTKYFDTVVASGDIGVAKPEARAFEITAERLGVRLDECVMIDDREVYLAGARAVGMQTILYESFPQLKQSLERLGV